MEINLMKQFVQRVLIGLLLISGQTIHAGNSSHSDSKAVAEENAHEDEGLIEISPSGQKAAGIKIELLELKPLSIYISAPGEVIPNSNQTSIVTPRIQAQVVKRLVQIGDYVKKDTPIVRLSSVDMAKAQSSLLLAKKEWHRVKSLGERAVSAKRYQIAEVAYQQAYSKLLAYGMTRVQIEDFLKSGDLNKANGDFALLAPRDGTIFSADFVEGQMVQPGKILYKIVNEKSLWVDAKLSNGESATIKKGAHAIIKTALDTFPAEVLRVHHKLDETTRTRIVRLNVLNPKDSLHPGEFVTCLIEKQKSSPVLAVDETTLMRTPDGDVAVYVEVKPNHFQAKEVQVIKKIGTQRIIKGINPGERIVTKGAFFVHSESMKSGFNVHNH